ncbi:hemolysin III family protein, partial [Vibrio sp. 1287]|nr:hemolysin III family protein [Vibrio sp. 1287]
MSSPQKPQYSQSEELANTITHGIGMIFGIVGLILLLIKATNHQADTLTVTSMAI